MNYPFSCLKTNGVMSGGPVYDYASHGNAWQFTQSGYYSQFDCFAAPFRVAWYALGWEIVFFSLIVAIVAACFFLYFKFVVAVLAGEVR